jgi:hypothetical protein
MVTEAKMKRQASVICSGRVLRLLSEMTPTLIVLESTCKVLKLFQIAVKRFKETEDPMNFLQLLLIDLTLILTCF